MSILREYVCEVTGYAYGKSDISVTSRSSSSTYLLQKIIRRNGDTAQNSAHLVMVAIKQREEASLRSRGAFNAAETQIVPRPLNVAEVPEQFL